MKKFINLTKQGNEKALRRGKRVPQSDVNLAWVKAPALSPKENMIILDASEMSQQSRVKNPEKASLYYANYMGILEDATGNQIVQDEYPFVTDIFAGAEEDFVFRMGNEYLGRTILPFKHVSRFYHLDRGGLTKNDIVSPFTTSNAIKIVDHNGKEYVDDKGKPKYKIYLVMADNSLYRNFDTRSVGVYKVWAFVDTDKNEDLYLTYNKVELDGDGKVYKKQNINHKEILNPQAYFKYNPEESAVIDFANSKQKWYATKPVALKAQILDSPSGSVDGYKVYVPKKAVADPRLFQLFRWRVKCEFVERYKVDPTDKNVLNVGILTLDPKYPRTEDEYNTQPPEGITYNYYNPASTRPYVFYNMERSSWNTNNLKFVNPISEKRGYTIVEDFEDDPGIIDRDIPFYPWQTTFQVPLRKVTGEEAKDFQNYWIVNLATVTNEELKEFDMLVGVLKGDLSPYLNKINYFTQTLGRQLILEGDMRSTIDGLGPQVSWPVHGLFGRNTWPGYWETPSWAHSEWAHSFRMRAVDKNHWLFKGLESLGGWDFTDQDFANTGPGNSEYARAIFQYGWQCAIQVFWDAADWEPIFVASGTQTVSVDFGQTPSDWSTWTIVTAPTQEYPVALMKSYPSGGSIYYAPMDHLLWVSRVPVADTENFGPRRYYHEDYTKFLNTQFLAGAAGGQGVEGVAKMLFNYCLYASKRKPLDSSDERTYSSTWVFEASWKSSWVINGGVLLDEEKQEHNFKFEPKEVNTPADMAWRRQLDAKTLKEIIDAEIVQELGEDYLRQIAGMNRIYTIEVTNKNVSTPSVLDDNSRPYAWTEAYSPPFNIPVELGPNIIKSDPMIGEYSAGEYVHKSYPPQKYNVKINANYHDSSETLANQTTTFKAWFTAIETIESSVPVKSTKMNINWSSHGSETNNYSRYDTKWGSGLFQVPWGTPHPNGITTWSENHWDKNQIWPYMGIVGRYENGSSGEVVRFIQHSLNTLSRLVNEMEELYPAGNPWADNTIRYKHLQGALVEDGIYGDKTQAAVQRVQQLANSKFQDGIADSEFFAILGSQILLWGIGGEIIWIADTTWLNPADGITYHAGDVIKWGQWNLPGTGIAHGINVSRFDSAPNDYRRYSTEAFQTGDLRNMSDGSYLYGFSQITGFKDGASQVSDIYVVQFPKSYNFNELTAIPSLLSSNDDMKIDFLDVRTTRITAPAQVAYDAALTTSSLPTLKEFMWGYNWNTAMMSGIGDVYHGRSGENINMPLYNPREGNTILIGVSNNKPSGKMFGSLVSLGVSDFSGWATVAKGGYSTRVVQPYIGFVEKTITLSGGEQTFQIQAEYDGPGVLTNVEFGYNAVPLVQMRQPESKVETWMGHYQVESSNPDIMVGVTKQGHVSVASNPIYQNRGSGFTEGQWIPNPPDIAPADGMNFISGIQDNHYSTFNYSDNVPHAMDEDGKLYPGSETGFIRKTDGIKLLCTKDKKPLGFPAMPGGVGPNEYQRHFVELALQTSGSSELIKFGFYDFAQREFIVSPSGEPIISYLEYFKRGPQNIYVGMITEAEVEEKRPLPAPEASTPKIPFKWAMPVYGVYDQGRSKIAIEPLPPDLGPTDTWYIPVRSGSFDKKISIPDRTVQPLSGWISKYQSQTLHAFYGLPELNDANWSDLWGPPNIDIIGEHPLILDEYTIQVRQAPIIMAPLHTATPSDADPVRPIFRIWKRPNILSAWEEIPLVKVKDYNVSNGTIYLYDPLQAIDGDLVKINYTTSRGIYKFKEYNGLKLNLNPYPGHRRDLIGKSIYVYIVPKYVKGENGRLISEGFNDRALRATIDGSIFDPLNSAYDPLAIMIGVVYISPALHIEDLQMFDTRTRGGGALKELALAEMQKAVKDSVGYWDINFGAGFSYQTGSFIIVRLPKELKEQFPDVQDIKDTIDRNITVGVQYKIETLQGEDW